MGLVEQRPDSDTEARVAGVAVMSLFIRSGSRTLGVAMGALGYPIPVHPLQIYNTIGMGGKSLVYFF